MSAEVQENPKASFRYVHSLGLLRNSRQKLGDLRSSDVALGDVDGDGDLDAFVANRSSDPGIARNQVWLNDGDGNFRNSGQRLGSYYSESVIMGDVDGDGDLDAFVGNHRESGSDKVWLNDGTGTFSDSGQVLSMSGSYDLAIGDIDGDNDLDVLIQSRFSASSLWLNDGDGTFADSGQILIDPGDPAIRRDVMTVPP